MTDEHEDDMSRFCAPEKWLPDFQACDSRHRFSARSGACDPAYYRLPQIENYAPLASVSVILMTQLLGADIQQCAREFATYQNYESSGNLYQIAMANGSFHVYDQSRRGE